MSKKSSLPLQRSQAAAPSSDYPTEKQFVYALINSKNGHPVPRFLVEEMFRYASNPLPMGFNPPYRIVKIATKESADLEAVSKQQPSSSKRRFRFDYDYDRGVTGTETTNDQGSKDTARDLSHAEHDTEAPYPLPGSDKFVYGLRATRDIPNESIISYAGGRWVAYAGDPADKQLQWFDSFSPSNTSTPVQDEKLIKELTQYVAFYGEYLIMGNYFVVPNGLPSELNIGEGFQESYESVVGSETASRMNCAHLALPPPIDLGQLRDLLAENNYAAERSDYEKIHAAFESMSAPTCNAVRANYPGTMIVTLRSTRPIKSGELIVCRYPLTTMICMAIRDKSVVLSDKVMKDLQAASDRVLEHAVEIQSEAANKSAAEQGNDATSAASNKAVAKKEAPKRAASGKSSPSSSESNTRARSSQPPVSSATPSRASASQSKAPTKSAKSADKPSRKSPPSSGDSSPGSSSDEESEATVVMLKADAE